MEEKAIKTFKDKLKDRVSLVKQKSTELLLNTKSNSARHSSDRDNDIQRIVDSLLPEIHQEIEIEQALNDYVTDSTTKETSQQMKERKKIEDDFFFGVSTDNDDSKPSKTKSKRKSKGSKTNSPEDGVSKDKNKSPMKIASEYFDLEINKPELLTGSVVTRINHDIEAKDLFWDGTIRAVETLLPQVNFSDDGLATGKKPKFDSTRLKGILSHSIDSSLWFNSEGELQMLDCPIRDFDNEELRFVTSNQTEINTRFVEAERTVSDNTTTLTNQAVFDEKRILEIDLLTLKFNHHPLFSLEHILARRLENAYNKYVQKKKHSLLKELNENLTALRKRLNEEKQEFLRANNNSYKKLYKNEEFQKKVKEVTTVMKSRKHESMNERELEEHILKLWRHIKYVRKQMKFVCSDVVLEIQKKKTILEDERIEWETMFDDEVSNTLDQIKCEYLQMKTQYVNERNESDSRSKIKKPILDCDEDKIRRKVFNEMCEAFRQPGDLILSFQLSHDPEIVTVTVEYTDEMRRKSDVEKTKIFLKLRIDNKEVCRTKPVQLTKDFVVDFNTSFSVFIPETTENMVLSVLEQGSFLNPTLLGEVIIKIPEENTTRLKIKLEEYDFKLNFVSNNNHFGAGNSTTITEMINKKLTDFKFGYLDVENQLDSTGSIQINIGWTREIDNSESRLIPFNNFQNKIPSYQKPTKEMLTQLFDNVLDPNDPKHVFLYTFLNTYQGKNICTPNFYLNDCFNFNFTPKQRGDKIEVDVANQNELNSNENGSQLVPYDIASVSGGTSKTPRQSILDDASFANRVLEPIDLHKRMSVRYLELVNEHLMMQNEKEKEKKLSDILTFVEYHTIRNIKMDFLRPRQPLFHPSNNKQPSVTLKASVERGKEYSLKVCVLKAFQLPCRVEGNTPEEDGGLKMISLRPFVRVSCQGVSLRTSTTVGNNPTWNQQLFFTVKNEESSEINVHLFDEIIEDMLEDDRLETSTVHCQYSANWLASLRVPLINVVTQPKMEGIFLMYSPPELIGYKQSNEDRFTTTLDGLRKEINVKQKGGYYVSLLLETYPNHTNDLQIPRELLESNEMEYMIRYLNTFADTYKNQFPTRKINLLVLDTSGKHVCLTRFFKGLPLPDFAESIRSFNNMNVPNLDQGSEHSSKSSTPNRRKKNQDIEDVTSQSTKSLLSGGDTGRLSKTTKEIFEMRSLNDAGDDSERGLALKVNACVRFVSLIPLYQKVDTSNYCIALTGYQTLRLVCGSAFDHTTLLMSYFLQLEIECWCVLGHSLQRGHSSYVLVREKQNPNEMDYKNGKMSLSRSRNINWKYFIYDAVTGVKYDTKDSFCPLQKVFLVCNNENIWVNVQAAERCSLVRFNLKDTSDWRPVFQKQLMACPGPLPGVLTEDGLYSYSTQDVARLRDAIEDKIKAKIQKWRGHRRTVWNRNCSSILRKSLINWEKWYLNPLGVKPKMSQKLQQMMLSYQMYGYPYNVTYTSIRDIILCVKATQIHLDEHNHTEYALAVDIFPYPNRVFSVWIYVSTLVRKVET